MSPDDRIALAFGVPNPVMGPPVPQVAPPTFLLGLARLGYFPSPSARRAITPTWPTCDDAKGVSHWALSG